MKKTYIMIGGGLAGMMLAARLCIAGERAIVIDDGSPKGASRIAAGMFNVITGKHARKTWLAHELLASLQDFFQIPAFLPLQSCLNTQPLFRPFKDIGEYNDWLGKSQTESLKPFIYFQETPHPCPALYNPFGGIWIHQCGYLWVESFLKQLQNILTEKYDFTYISASVSSHDMRLEEKYLLINGKKIPFSHVILTQGASIADFPEWKIPIIPTKGEILQIFAPTLSIDFAISGKTYLVPQGNGYFIAGATHEWAFSTPDPTSENRKILEDDLKKTIRASFSITAHRAGIRPATHDRRPILGTHPNLPHLHVFSGFGSKGVLLSPYFSEVMARYLLGEIPSLSREYSLERYSVVGK